MFNDLQDLSYPHVVRRLTEAFSHPLPGSQAHALMAPRPARTWPAGFNIASRRDAAGLVLVHPIEQIAHVVLTVRSEHVRHGGQVSLPGGVIEPGESVEDAALREAHEEMALSVDAVRLLGRLTPLDIPVSGFRLHPVVGVVDQEPALARADREVARIVHVPLPALVDRSAYVSQEIIREERAILAPSFVVGDLMVWGATAMVLAEFLTLLGWQPHHFD